MGVEKWKKSSYSFECAALQKKELRASLPAERKKIFSFLPGTPLLRCATEAHLRNFVTGLLSSVLPESELRSGQSGQQITRSRDHLISRALRLLCSSALYAGRDVLQGLKPKIISAFAARLRSLLLALLTPG